MTRPDATAEPDDEPSKTIAAMYDHCTRDEESCFRCIEAGHSLAVDGMRCGYHRSLFQMIRTIDVNTAQLQARAEAAEELAEEEQTKRIDAEVMASIDKVEATECIELKNALGIEWDSGGDEYSTQRWVTVDALDDQTFDNMTKAGEAIISQLTAALATIERVRALPIDMSARADSERLDWLDAINERTNRRNGTVYGWGLTINHNRTALEDHHFPARTVREALDDAIEGAT